MTNEEFQKMVLEKFAQLDDKIVTLATKDDIANMATKDDIANMATKDDIANMATKDDIANMATKDDIANMATKDDIANMATKDDIANLPTREELHKVIAEQQKDIVAMLQIMDKKLTTIQETQVIQGESINILAMRQLQCESEIAALKKAK
ncbi:Hypothetical protein LUCI_4626 [Lucifera butyrica]|uniref:Uncharacterized protein n=1 Tax=Lucifera butyrica TaxID=1351585 RepID=A0A498R9F4_9FIRM|nr:hypothetical protein [Lucifera butyrica]VBB09336.1 Hypothetical protein LUCI_4626 [Lucifera butyrica]